MDVQRMEVPRHTHGYLFLGSKNRHPWPHRALKRYINIHSFTKPRHHTDHRLHSNPPLIADSLQLCQIVIAALPLLAFAKRKAG